MILKFDTESSHVSNPVVRRSLSPRRTHQLSSSGDLRFQLRNEQEVSPDYVVHHTLLAKKSTVSSWCPACNNVLRPNGTSHGGACINPHCDVYMIPVENIDIFTSAMEDTGDAFALVETNDRSHSRGASWGDNRFGQLRGIDRRRWLDKRGGLALFNESIESRDSSVDCSNTVSSNAADVLLSRMTEARNRSNDIAPKKRPNEKSDMAVLIDRLASAAVAIKDLEESVQAAEENSPQRSLNGRPPTSPRTKSPNLGSDSNTRWF